MRRRSVIVVLAVLALVAVATAADEVLIEDWKAYKVGTTGLPGEWKAQNWGTPNYQNIKIVDDDAHRALYMKSVNDGTTINREIKGKVHLKDTPILEWEWKVIVLPKGGNSCKKATDDQAGQIFLVWPRFPEAVRSRIIGYLCDTTPPAGTICKSEKTGMVTYIVVHSGPADLNRWVTEAQRRRGLQADLRRGARRPRRALHRHRLERYQLHGRGHDRSHPLQEPLTASSA